MQKKNVIGFKSRRRKKKKVKEWQKAASQSRRQERSEKKAERREQSERRKQEKNPRQAREARSRQIRRRFLWGLSAFGGIAAAGAVLFVVWAFWGGKKEEGTQPDLLLKEYMACIPKKEYGKMYGMVDAEASDIGQEEFVRRNADIYEGIELQDLEIQVTDYNKETGVVKYLTELRMAAGSISFENRAFFQKGEDGYRLVWSNSLIFPELTETDRIKISTTQAERGSILDRNGTVLAGKGTASSVGIVPGKLVDRASAVNRLSELLDIQPEVIEKKLSAQWVREDSFVPLKTLPKVQEIDLLSPEPEAEVLAELGRQEELLKIPGVKIQDTGIRQYPLGAAAAHLVGYVQGVTAEDLAEHVNEGYTESSLIGKSGMEALFEKELKGQNGFRLSIADEAGNEKKELARVEVQHGQDVKLTIDAGLQQSLYEQFREDKGCSVAMDPYTGEVLALVSTPSFDNNDFIKGITEEAWEVLNDGEQKPMFNRFRQVWCPGSTLKPVIAAIGLDSGAVNPAEDFGNEGLRWQKDASWGNYFISTLHECAPATLENAMIYSDNIYFAKAALKIGAETLEASLQSFGFSEAVPFEIAMYGSTYSNGEHIETEIQLADSGYGQGQMLMNPLHLACLYTAFCNGGNVIKPYLVYREEAAGEIWISQAFSAQTSQILLENLKKVVNDPNGTGYKAFREDVLLAGKTGTAEIKSSKEDEEGTELGWFAVFTADPAVSRPILLVSMTEDVKDRGGSAYVVERDSLALAQWFGF